MTEFSYVVTHVTSSTAITNDVEDIELVDTGTGEIKSAKITLNALNGKYLTAAPKLAQFDQVKVKITDEDSTDYEEIYEIDRIIPIKNAGEGYKVEIECLGQEQHLQKVDISKQFYFAPANTVADDICEFYNDANGSSQPTVQHHDTYTTGNNELPRWTANNYEFGVSEIKAYDALLNVVEGLGASVANGGAGDFYELYFATNTADPTKINFNAFVSGSQPASGSEVTITDSTAVNEAPTEGGIDAITGSVVKAWGRKGSGSLPTSFASFAGELEAYLLEPTHITGVTYPLNAKVQLNGVHYQAIAETSSTPPTSDWVVKTFDYYRGSTNGYSGSAKGIGCWDSNLIVEDGTYYQDWVHVKSTNPDNANVLPFKYGAAAGGNYRGLRVLCNGTGAGDFSGNDSNGVAFTGNIAQHDGTEWLVIKQTSNDYRCAVLDEGKVYEKQSGTWTDISGDARENHCFHLVESTANVAGYNSTSDGTGTYGDSSAVEWSYQYTAFDAIPGAFYTSDGFYKIGAWANFSLPFPENSHNGATLASIYGNNSTKKEPATIDVNNMHLTSSGNVGFNNSEADELGSLDGIKFWIRFNWTDLLGNQALQGDFKMRAFMYDRNSNVVVADFVIPFNNIWAPIHIPFSSFNPYRARIPLSLGNIAPNLFTNDLEVLNVFQWKNIKRIGVQWQEVYDDQGRYSPEGTRAITGVAAGIADLKLAIDGFHFTKPLLAVTSPDTTRNIEPRAIQAPDISNSVQLNQIANSQLDIEQFQHKEYTVTTAGKIDINFGDTFFLNDSTLIDDADTRTADSGGSSNTIRLVAKRIVYKITKNNNGAGNFLRTILGIKRLLT